MINLWVVRAGKYGEQEAACLSKGIVTIGWSSLPDLRKFKAREQLQTEYQKHYAEKNPYALGLKVGQIWRFANEIKKGDLVVLPSKFNPEIHVGIVTNAYSYQKLADDVVHIVSVDWKKTVSRVEFDKDLLFSFGSLLTVSKISRNNAAERVRQQIEGKVKSKKSDPAPVDVEGDSVEYANADELAYTKIEKYIQENFKEYEFESLIREILRTQNFNTARTKEIGDINTKKKKGADGGVDILASKGALGFEQPRLCVQVKSGQGKLGAQVLRELVGVMARFEADYGLLVSWGGFSNELIREAQTKYFTIRLWNSDDVIKEIFNNYEAFSEEFQAKLPFKRIWVLDSPDDV